MTVFQLKLLTVRNNFNHDANIIKQLENTNKLRLKLQQDFGIVKFKTLIPYGFNHEQQQQDLKSTFKLC